MKERKKEKKRNVVKQLAFSSRRQKKFLKPIVVILKCPVCVFISLRDRDRVNRPRRRSQGFVTRSCPTKECMTNLWEATIEFDCWITTDSFRVLHAVDSVNVKQELGFKSKAILYHVYISGRLIGKGVLTSLDGSNGRSIQTLLRE